MGKLKVEDLMVKELAGDDYLTCYKCGNTKVIALFIMSIWWDRGICLDCCQLVKERGENNDITNSGFNICNTGGYYSNTPSS